MNIKITKSEKLKEKPKTAEGLVQAANQSRFFFVCCHQGTGPSAFSFRQGKGSYEESCCRGKEDRKDSGAVGGT